MDGEAAKDMSVVAPCFILLTLSTVFTYQEFTEVCSDIYITVELFLWSFLGSHNPEISVANLLAFGR